MTNPYAPGKSDDHDNWRVKAEGSGEWFKGIRFQLIHVATERFLGSSAQLSHPSIPPGQQAVACVAQDTDETWWSAPSGEQPEAIQFSALKVDLGPSLAAVSFGTPAELLEWWRRERSFNAWLQTRSGPAARTVNEALHEIEDEVVRLNDVPVRRQSVIAWQNAGRKLAGAYQQRRLIHSSSPEGMLIAGRVAANRPEEAEGALEFFLGEAKGEAVGLVKALLFQAGVGDQDIHSNRLAELHANWDRRFAQSHQDAVDAEAAARERLASAEKTWRPLKTPIMQSWPLRHPFSTGEKSGMTIGGARGYSEPYS